MDYFLEYKIALRYLNISIMALGLILLILDIKSSRQKIGKILPYSIFSFICILFLGAYSSLLGSQLLETVNIISKNVIAICTASLIAVVGLVSLSETTSNEYIHPIFNDDYDIFKIIPIKRITLIALILGIYAIAVIELFEFKSTYILPLAEIVIGINAGFIEELFYRIGYLGIFVYLLRRSKYNWEIAIILSTIFWLDSHFHDIGDYNYIRIIELLPIGLTLGYVLKKYGFESSVLMHVITNLIITIFFLIFV